MHVKIEYFGQHHKLKKFTIKSTQNYIASLNHMMENRIWRLIWKRPIVNPIHTFLMVGIQNCLLTNLERSRHHFSSNSFFSLYNIEAESVIYVIHDCSLAKLFRVLLFLLILMVFFTVKICLIGFIRTLGRFSQLPIPLSVLFGIIVWFFWRWRNEAKFNHHNIFTCKKIILIKNILKILFVLGCTLFPQMLVCICP